MDARKRLLLGGVLLLGALAASTSGIWVKFSSAPAGAVVFYRNLLAFIVFFSILSRRMFRASPASFKAVYSWRSFSWNLAGGAAFAGHLIFWILSVHHTTLANAALCFSINPLSTAILAWIFFKEKSDAWLALSILLGVLGVIVIGYVDLSLSPSLLTGDLLGVASGLFFSLYILLGKKVRTGNISNAYYMTFLFAGACMVAAVFMIINGIPFGGYGWREWVTFIGITLFPTFLGHTIFNWLVTYFNASIISTATLSEPLFAGLMAWMFYGEGMHRGTWGGYVLIVGSVLLLGKSLQREPAQVTTTNSE